MAMSNWEKFINRLNEHGITAKGTKDPVALADGIAELMDIADSYEEQMERILLYALCINDANKKWEETCDNLDNLNRMMKSELNRIPHKIIEKVKAAGMPVPKGIGKMTPKKFESVTDAENVAARAQAKEAKKFQKKLNAGNPIPANVFSAPPTDPWANAVARYQEAVNAHSD